jgi:hypothetical protein
VPSPFPGMDPYLEDPELWPAVHTDLIVALRDALVPLLRPRYFVTIELREYEISLAELELLAIGDVSITQPRPPRGGTNGPSPAVSAVSAQPGEEGEAVPVRPGVLTVQVPRPVPVRERYLEIRRPRSHELITVIEVLSPTNKRTGKGRQQYEQKRLAIAETQTNLVEIDLLRAGEPMPLLHRGAPLARAMAGDYRVVVSRGHLRHRADLYVISVRQALPTIPIPLREGEAEPQVDLQQVLNTVYDRGAYDMAVDYRLEPVSPLAPADAAWADRLLRERGLR